MMNNEYRVVSGIFGYKSLGFFRPVLSLQSGGIEVKGVSLPYEAINRVIIKECFVPQTRYGCSYYKSQMVIHIADRKLKIKGSALLHKEDPWSHKFIDGKTNDGRSPAYKYAKSQICQNLGSKVNIEESQYAFKVTKLIIVTLCVVIFIIIFYFLNQLFVPFLDTR